MATFTTNYSLNKIELAENSLNAIFTEGNSNLDAIDGLIKTQETNLGNKTVLSTSDKTNLVSAINELNTKYILEKGDKGDIGFTGANGFSSIVESKFTVTSNNTTNLVHGIVGFDSSKDNLVVIDNYTGGELEKGIEYTENINLLSVDLVGWGAKIGESFSFKLFKNLNEATIQAVINNSIVKKGELNDSVVIANTTKTNLQNVINTADLVTYASFGDIGNKVNLTTTDKTNLVSAINELNAKITIIIDGGIF